MWGVESHCSALLGSTISQPSRPKRQAQAVRTPSEWFSIYAAPVLSQETAVNRTRPIKDQDCEVGLKYSLITKICDWAEYDNSLQFKKCVSDETVLLSK